MPIQPYQPMQGLFMSYAIGGPWPKTVQVQRSVVATDSKDNWGHQ